jgi:hypothetical protein
MKKLYILVSDKLSLAYQGVQGAHALAQWMLDDPEGAQEWNNGTLIFLVCNTTKMQTKLYTHKKDHTRFKEPDMNNYVTAIACYDTGEIFKDYKLMGS